MQIDTRNPEFQDALNLIQYTRQSVLPEVRMCQREKKARGLGAYGYCGHQRRRKYFA